MRTLALATLMIGAALSPSLFAHETENLNYNIVNIQADAARQVANDEMRAVLYIEKSHKQPAELSNQINQLMNQAQAISRKYSQVKVETGAQSTYPVYEMTAVSYRNGAHAQKSKLKVKTLRRQAS